MIHRGNQPERSPAYLTLHELGEVSCMPEACTYGSRSGINSFTKVRSGRRPVCPCCTLTLWDFLFVTGCWCLAESAAQGTWHSFNRTMKLSSVVAHQSLFSPHRSERTAGCTTAGNPLCDYNTQTHAVCWLPVSTCFSVLNTGTDQIKNLQRPKPPGWCHISAASVTLRL